jgi:hypothetical protein
MKVNQYKIWNYLFKYSLHRKIVEIEIVDVTEICIVCDVGYHILYLYHETLEKLDLDLGLR